MTGIEGHVCFLNIFILHFWKENKTINLFKSLERHKSLMLGAAKLNTLCSIKVWRHTDANCFLFVAWPNGIISITLKISDIEPPAQPSSIKRRAWLEDCFLPEQVWNDRCSRASAVKEELKEEEGPKVSNNHSGKNGSELTPHTLSGQGSWTLRTRGAIWRSEASSLIF